MDVELGDFEDRELAGLLASVSAAACGAVMVTDPAELIVYVNDAFTRMTGYAPEEVTGRTPHLLQCERTDVAERHRIRAALDREEPVEAQLLNRTKRGHAFWMDVAIEPVVDATGTLTHFVSTLHDVSEQRARELATERTLRGIHGRLHNAFLHAPVAMATASPDGRLHEVNGALAVLLSRTEADLAGRTLFEVTHEDDLPAAQEACRRLSVTGATSRQEVRMVRPDGTQLRAVVQAALVRDAEAAGDHIVLQVEDVSDRYAMEDELVRLALSDVLTQLPNRTMLQDRLAQATARRNRDRSSLAVLFVDVDAFKAINDTHGHAAGDAALVDLARHLQEAVRPGDTVARIGGDEFVVVCERATPAEAERIAARLVDVAAVPVSVGVAVARGEALAVAEALLADADVAMYEAKRRGGHRWMRFAPDLRGDVDRREIDSGAVEAALAAGEFILHYQPQVDVATGRVTGVEALARWRHPEHGLLAPDQLTAGAERSGAMVALGTWLARQACLDAADAGGETVVWVTLCAQQLRPDLVEEIAGAARVAGLPPRRLGLQVAESVLLADLGMARRLLADLSARGFRLAIDAFGAGYSSLAYLAELPVDAVRVDRSFAAHLEPGGRGHLVVAATLGAAQALGLTVIVDGVDAVPQLRALHALGVPHAQGELLGRAAPGLRAALNAHAEPLSEDRAGRR